VPDYADVPADILRKLRDRCLALPDVAEEQAWTGRRFVVRRRNFAHVFARCNEHGELVTIVAVRSPDEERGALVASGHPFFRLGWGRDAIGMVLDQNTDWEEVREIVTESYCVLAPKKLVALVDRPDPVEEGSRLSRE
jgi:hypothetical protein